MFPLPALQDWAALHGRNQAVVLALRTTGLQVQRRWFDNTGRLPRTGFLGELFAIVLVQSTAKVETRSPPKKTKTQVRLELV